MFGMLLQALGASPVVVIRQISRVWPGLLMECIWHPRAMMELSAYGRFCRRTCMNAGHTSSSGSLHILTGNEKGKTFILNTMFGSSIGRDPSGNDIVLSDDSVSRSHARISYDGSRWNIE